LISVSQCPLVLLAPWLLVPMRQDSRELQASGAAEAQPAVAAWDCQSSNHLW
jgi:hypothetical protein